MLLPGGCLHFGGGGGGGGVGAQDVQKVGPGRGRAVSTQAQILMSPLGCQVVSRQRQLRVSSRLPLPSPPGLCPSWLVSIALKFWGLLPGYGLPFSPTTTPWDLHWVVMSFQKTHLCCPSFSLSWQCLPYRCQVGSRFCPLREGHTSRLGTP